MKVQMTGATANALACAMERCLGPVDKPVLAPAQPERLGRCNADVATGVTR
jgi:hypothetical protein